MKPKEVKVGDKALEDLEEILKDPDVPKETEGPPIRLTVKQRKLKEEEEQRKRDEEAERKRPTLQKGLAAAQTFGKNFLK